MLVLGLIIDVPVITDTITVATVTHQGSSNFAVVSYIPSGERISLLVNDIGNYQGTVSLNFSVAPAELEITASGRWTVTHSDALDHPICDGSLFEGSGDQVLRVNEIRPFESTVRLGNPLALEITADGQWTLVSQ